MQGSKLLIKLSRKGRASRQRAARPIQRLLRHVLRHLQITNLRNHRLAPSNPKRRALQPPGKSNPANSLQNQSRTTIRLTHTRPQQSRTRETINIDVAFIPILILLSHPQRRHRNKPIGAQRLGQHRPIARLVNVQRQQRMGKNIAFRKRNDRYG